MEIGQPAGIDHSFSLGAFPAALVETAERGQRVRTADTQLAATLRLGGDLTCLVFASARNPGREPLLADPYPVSFLTAAAPNRAAIARSQPQHLPGLPAMLSRRAARILAVAAAHGHRRLVLGAWGCGVFGNDPATVAAAFATALRASPWFDEVTFAVLDRQTGTPTLAAFANVLGLPPQGPPTTGE
jgi:hypothetical protein